MDINFSDIQLKLLLETGKSRTYSCIQRKTAVRNKLIYIYNILQDINGFEDLTHFKSITIKEESSEIYHIPLDGSDNIKMVFLLQGDVIDILSLKISGTNNE